MSSIVVEVGQNETKSWFATISNGPDLTQNGIILSCQIRASDDTLLGTMTAVITGPNTYTLTIANTTTITATPGLYAFDVLATRDDFTTTYVSPVIGLNIIRRITKI